jgi:hypothetical protein
VTGPAGSGKSALVARAVGVVREALPEAAVVVRFAGLTPDSSASAPLARALGLEVRRAFGLGAAAPEEASPPMNSSRAWRSRGPTNSSSCSSTTSTN